MATNESEILFILKLLGVKNASSELETFIRLFEKAGGFDLAKMEKSAAAVAKEVGRAAQEVRNLVVELGRVTSVQSLGERFPRLSGQQSQKAIVNSLSQLTAPLIKQQKELDQVFKDNIKDAKAEPAFQSRFRGRGEKGNFFEETERIEREVAPAIGESKLTNSEKVKTAVKLLSSARARAEIELKLTDDVKRRAAIVDRIRRLNRIVPERAGIIGVNSPFAAKGVSSITAGPIIKSQIANDKWVASQDRANAASIAGKKATDQQTVSQDKLDNRIGVAIGKLIRYRVAFFAMRGAIDAVKSTIQEFIEVQFGLAQLDIVIDKTTDNIEDLKSSAFGLAAEFASNVGEVIKVMRVWAQTGLKQNEINEATRATLVGMNALSVEAKQVTEALTAAIFTYGIDAQDVTIVLSKWLAVQREFPISAQDLANSLKVVGAAAKVVGVDIDDLSGFIAAIGSATRKSGTAVGQSLKTIFARIPRKEVIKAFEELDIGVLRTSNELRDLDNILFDLNKKWGSLSTVQKANISVTLGGIRRYADFIALMDNFNIKLAATAIAQRATTEVQEANFTVMETFKKQWESTLATIKQFSEAVGTVLGESLIKVVRLIKEFAEILNAGNGSITRVVAGFIQFASVASVLAITLLSVKFLYGTIAKALIGFTTVTLAAKTATAGFAASELAATVTTGIFTKSLILLRATLSSLNFWILAISTGLALFTIFRKKEETATKRANIALERNVKIIERSISKSKQLVALRETELQILEDAPSRLKKLTDALRAAPDETSPIITESLQGLKSLLQGLPRTFEPLNAAQEEFALSQEKSVELAERLQEAIAGAAENTKKLLKQEKERLQSNIDDEVDKKRAKIETFREATVALKNFSREEEKLFQISIRRDIPILEQVVKVEFDFSASVPNALRELSDKLTGFQDVGRTFGEILGKQLSGKETADQIKRGLKLTADVIAKQAFPIARTLKNEIRNILTKAGLTEEDIKGLNLVDVSAIIQAQLGTFDLIFQDAIEKTGANFRTLQDVIDAKKVDEFVTLLTKLFIEPQKTIADSLDLNKSLATVRGILISQIESGEIEASKLLRVLELIDSQFKVGTKLPQAIVTFSEKMNKAAQSFSNVAEQLNLKRVTLDFGTLISFDEFEVKQAEQFINTSNKLILESQRRIEVLAEDEKKLVKVQKGLEVIKNKLSTEGGQALLSNLLAEVNLREKLRNSLLGQKNADQLVLNLIKDNTLELNFQRQALIDVADAQKRAAALDILFKWRRALIDIGDETREITNTFRGLTDPIDSQIKSLKAFKDKDEEIFALEKRKLGLQNQQAREIAKIQFLGKDIKDVQKLVNVEYKKGVDLLKKQRDVRLDKILEKAAVNALAFRNALTTGIANISNNIVEGMERRTELTEEMRQAEFELQEARREGDKEAITSAEHRIDVINTEIENYKRGWFEIRALVTDIFDSIGKQFQANLIESFVRGFANISIGNTALGDIIGDALGRASGQFADTWRTAAENVNANYIIAQVDIFQQYLDGWADISNRFLEEERRIKEIERARIQAKGAAKIDVPGEIRLTRSSSSLSAALTNSVFQTVSGQIIAGTIKISEDILKQKKVAEEVLEENKKQVIELEGNRKTIRDGFVLLGTTFAQSIAGAGRGSQAGAGIGSLFGSSFGTSLAKSTFAAEFLPGFLGFFGGIAGGILGSIFNKTKAPEEPLIRSVDSNTDATLQNTIALKELDKVLFNAPARFSVPAFSGSSGRSITVNINGAGDPQAIADNVIRTINDAFDEDERAFSTRGFAPI